MSKLLGIVGTVFVVGILLLWGVDPTYRQQREDQRIYAERQHELELERQAYELQRRQQLDSATLPAQTGMQISMYILLPLLAVLVVGIAGDYYRQRRHPLVKADQRGMYPVSRRQLEDGALRDLIYSVAIEYHRAAQLRAIHQPGQMPASFSSTYAPHGASRLLDAQESPAADLASVPTFHELLTRGEIGSRQPLLLGYGESGPYTGDWRSLYSAGLGGVQGSGKTWTAAFLLAQSALNGARLLIVDPHAGDDESLASRLTPLSSCYLAGVAIADSDIIASLELARRELARRKSGSSDRWALIVAIDEWTALLRHDLRTQLPAFVADMTTEGRKYNIHCLLMAQRWAAESAGGGDVRNTLTACYVHRMRRQEAAMLSGLGESTPRDTLTLAPGECYLIDTRGTLQRVRIPHMTQADLVGVGGLLPSSSAATRAPEVRAKSNQVVQLGDLASAGSGRTSGGLRGDFGGSEESSASDRPAPAPALHVRVMRLFYDDGMDIPAIVRLIWPETKPGRQMQDRSSEVQSILRAGQRSAA